MAAVTAIPDHSGRIRPGNPAGLPSSASGNDVDATLLSLEQHQSGIHAVNERSDLGSDVTRASGALQLHGAGGSHAFDDGGGGHRAAGAHGDEGGAGVAALEFVQRGGEQPGAGAGLRGAGR